MEKISALYHATTKADRADRLARAIAVEQTVEVPEALIDERIEREIVGDVTAVDDLGGGRFAIRIEFAATLVNGLPALLNLVYGNVSMMEQVRLESLELPDSFLARFPGPNYGLAGLRELCGAPGRPLLCTVLKPRGAPAGRFDEIAYEFALAGGGLVKDDNNLIDASFEEFRERVARCQAAVTGANEKGGGRCRYLVNLCAPMGEVERWVEAALDLGVHGVLIPPILMGLDVVRDLAERHRLVVMAHPSFSGTLFQDRGHGIEPGVMMGTLYRLAGVDLSIFTIHGGRFSYSVEECTSITDACRAPLGSLRPCWPAPAGGMTPDRLPEMVEQFGVDTCVVVGGALLGDPRGVGAATAEYLEVLS